MTDEQANLVALQNYVSFQKLNVQLDRNLQLTESIRQRLKAQDSPDYRGRKSKPDDVVVMYERLIELAKDIATLGGQDAAIAAEMSSKSTAFGAFRCFYLGESYRFIKGWPQAYALFTRSGQLCDEAIKSLTSSKATDSAKVAIVESLKELSRDSTTARYRVHASAMLDNKSQQKTAEAEGERRAESVALLDRLNEFDAGSPSSNYNIVDFPPNLQPVPNKPTFFDLAAHSLAFPSVKQRAQANPSTGAGPGFLTSALSKLKLW